MRTLNVPRLLTITIALACVTGATPALAGAPPRLTCLPTAQRTQDVGCWILASEPLGSLPRGPYVLAGLPVCRPRRGNGRAARPRDGTGVTGRCVADEHSRRRLAAPGGKRVAVIRPLARNENEPYTAQYMEAVFPPGFDTPVHRHSGPEAWYTEAGEVCLETPDGKSVSRAGDPRGGVVRGEVPMRLSVTGTQQRRSLVLILHESSRAHTVLASDWTPLGLCRR